MTTWQIPKTNWSAVDGVSADDMNRMEANAQFASVMQYAGGTGTAITLYIGELMDGLLVTFIASNSNGGTATTINGKNLYKPYSTNTPNIIAHKAYTVWYNASDDCFFIKASAEGNAVAANVLAGTTFSNDDDTGISGTMANNPLNTNADHSIVENGILHLFIPFGAYLQPGTTDTKHSAVQISEPNLISANIKAGTSIFGVAGGIDLSNLNPDNIKENVNINGVVGTLEEKQDFSNYLFNLPPNYLPISYIEGEGLYCANVTSSERKCYLFDSQGNLTKTITNTGYGNSPTHITKNYIVWSYSLYSNITDKLGNLINSNIYIEIYNYSCINPNTQYIYIFSELSAYLTLQIYNFNGILLKTVQLISDSDIYCLNCIIPIKNGVVIIVKSSPNGQPIAYIVNDSGSMKALPYQNANLQAQLFSSAFKLV